jgi:hypothetical protein
MRSSGSAMPRISISPEALFTNLVECAKKKDWSFGYGIVSYASCFDNSPMDQARSDVAGQDAGVETFRRN